MQWPNFGQQDVQMGRSKKMLNCFWSIFQGWDQFLERQTATRWPLKICMFPKKSLFFPERNLTSTSRRKGKLSAKKISSWVKMIISGRACCSSFSLPPLNIQRCYLCALFWWMHSKEMWTFEKSSFEHWTNHMGKQNTKSYVFDKTQGALLTWMALHVQIWNPSQRLRKRSKLVN